MTESCLAQNSNYADANRTNRVPLERYDHILQLLFCVSVQIKQRLRAVLRYWLHLRRAYHREKWRKEQRWFTWDWRGQRSALASRAACPLQVRASSFAVCLPFLTSSISRLFSVLAPFSEVERALFRPRLRASFPSPLVGLGFELYFLDVWPAAFRYKSNER
jgi:hypothetical protein